MSDIKNIINTTYRLLSTNYLKFGTFKFNLFSIMIAFAVIVTIGWFIGRLLDTMD